MYLITHFYIMILHSDIIIVKGATSYFGFISTIIVNLKIYRFVRGRIHKKLNQIFELDIITKTDANKKRKSVNAIVLGNVFN